METRVATKVPNVETVIRPDMTVVDVGCYGWRLAEPCQRIGATLIGADRAEPPGKPAQARFAEIDKGAVAMPSESADVVVASHVLEHVVDAVSFMWELVRIAKPGGLIWIEAPSELAALPASTDNVEEHRFESFWDDPTHIRPWTPAAVYRLALSCHCIPLAIDRCDEAGIPSTRMLGRKPGHPRGVQRPRYVSLRNVPAGLRHAWSHVWPDHM
jgi:ubiquinone/menaquinone biosynthesis C-methylase UbiE